MNDFTNSWLLKDVSTVAVVCTQFGDSGKGKIVDLLAPWADIIARGTGGANAGHTIRRGDQEYVLHIVPSGILYDCEGKINVIGSGMVVDPIALCKELQVLDATGLTHNYLKVAYNSKLVLLSHILLDRLKESQGGLKIGTTGKGIGPAYVDYYDRHGLVMNDLLNPTRLREKLLRNLDHHRRWLRTFNRDLIEKIMFQEDLGGGKFYYPTDLFNFSEIIHQYEECGKSLQRMIVDTDSLLKRSVGEKNILLEGAQGNLLSIDHGTYPFVTSSDSTAAGLARGVGLKGGDIDRIFGIAKIYLTRVGKGPFPTELGGEQSERWCNDSLTTQASEQAIFPHASIISSYDFEQGIGIRQTGNEYGRTTGRPRRVGWLDLPLLRYSAQFIGRYLILTKLDVLDECPTIKVCEAYEYQGPDYVLGDQTFRAGDILKIARPEPEILQHCRPLYKEFEGWQTPITDITYYDNLPSQLKELLRYIEHATDLSIVMVSVGADKDKNISIYL